VVFLGVDGHRVGEPADDWPHLAIRSRVSSSPILLRPLLVDAGFGVITRTSVKAH
jgi:hypothetical protein